MRPGAAWRVPVAILLGPLLSCSPPTTSPQAPSDPASTKVATTSSQLRETWDVIYLQGAKVGYTHTKYEPVEERGRAGIRVSSESRLTFKRFGASIDQQIVVKSDESLDGGLLGFSSQIGGPAPIVTFGIVESGQLKITTVSQGQKTPSQIPWPATSGGFFATELSLERKPLRPGEKRQIRHLIPGYNVPADNNLEAIQYETTELLGESGELLKIHSVVGPIAGETIESYLWTDRTGQVRKMMMPGLGQASYRTTKDIALEKPSDPAFDLGEFATVRVGRRLLGPHQTRRIVYRIRLSGADPSHVLRTGPTQSVTAEDDHTVRVVVRALRPDDPEKIDSSLVSPPTELDTSPNNMIQSADRRIVELAFSVAAEEIDPWRIARQLEGLVRSKVRVQNFSTAFATAAEVAQTLEGDCTEHAVLLAALCRARRIPARVAMGLVYYPDAQGFAYHMWNEVWVRDRWIPLDATLGLGGIGGAHLKLVDSDLDGANAFVAFLPVLQVLGRLEIEILRVE